MGFDKLIRKQVGSEAEFSEQLICLKGTLTATSGAGTPYSKLNPLGAICLVDRVIIYTTGAISATPVEMNVGIGASAGGTYDTLIDGLVLSTPTAAGDFNNEDNGGTNGHSTDVWGATEYLTVTVTGTPTGLVGSIYVYYRKA